MSIVRGIVCTMFYIFSNIDINFNLMVRRPVLKFTTPRLCLQIISSEAFRPLRSSSKSFSLVEVNQAIKAWSFYLWLYCTSIKSMVTSVAMLAISKLSWAQLCLYLCSYWVEVKSWWNLVPHFTLFFLTEQKTASEIVGCDRLDGNLLSTALQCCKVLAKHIQK